MAIVAFLRGVNVGGRRRCRPALLAKQLQRYDVVNVGATGLFVVRNPGKGDVFRRDLLRRLPFEAQVVLCEARDLLALERKVNFGADSASPELVRFVNVLSGRAKKRPALPLGIPSDDDWYVRILGRNKQFVFGVYRRHMRTISYLGKIDDVLGVPVTTRSWSSIAAVCRILKGPE